MGLPTQLTAEIIQEEVQSTGKTPQALMYGASTDEAAAQELLKHFRPHAKDDESFLAIKAEELSPEHSPYILWPRLQTGKRILAK